jgi:hypothetical protein
MMRALAITLLATLLMTQASDAAPEASARANVFVFRPLTIQSTASMSFGKLHYAGNGPATSVVTLSARSPVSRATDGGAQLLPNGAETPAIRVLSGEPGRLYRVTIADTVSSPGLLRVTNYTLWSQNSGDITATRTGALNAQGGDTLRIGASLIVANGTKNDTFIANPSILIAYE